MKKILNLYAGVGGNRKLWPSDIEVTAVEIDSDIAEVYASLYPHDTLIIGDAHTYLQHNFDKFDFIWTSPPCLTHGSFRQNLGVRFRNVSPIYPDMRLYQEIIFLEYNFKGIWVVENVRPYYPPLINPTITIQRHLFWCNFYIENMYCESDKLRTSQILDLQLHLGIDLSKYKIKNKRQILRNCVHPYIGKHIYDQSQKINTQKYFKNNNEIYELFDMEEWLNE